MRREPVEFIFTTYQTDRELQVIDVALQLLADGGRLCNGERWRILDYLNDRFPRDKPPTLYQVEGGQEGESDGNEV